MILIFLAVAGVVFILTQTANASGTPQSGDVTTGGEMQVSTQDIAMYAANAGFTGGDLQVAVAVALAESGGNADAVGDLTITAGGSIGLWQINLHFHPEWTKEQLLDPQTNANAAYKIYVQAGNSFQPWSTYKNEAYAQYIVQAQGAVNA